MEGFQTCNNCRKVKTINEFGLKKDNKPYCECIECREKKKRKKQQTEIIPSIKPSINHETDEKKKEKIVQI